MSVGYGKSLHNVPVSDRSLDFNPPEHVDLAAVSVRGIKLGYTPDVLTDAGKFMVE